mmetsp:Transcript_26659/g.54573  ORF Transcript_26659/g.54573 Transcript_26659/m.54573 type:complete len:227 (-) Transcript_26659:867-1547(-)
MIKNTRKTQNNYPSWVARRGALAGAHWKRRLLSCKVRRLGRQDRPAFRRNRRNRQRAGRWRRRFDWSWFTAADGSEAPTALHLLQLLQNLESHEVCDAVPFLHVRFRHRLQIGPKRIRERFDVDAGAVELPHHVRAGVVVHRDEVRRPQDRQRLACDAQGVHDAAHLRQERFLELRETRFVRGVVSELRVGGDGGHLPLVRLLVHDPVHDVSHHLQAHLPLYDARE